MAPTRPLKRQKTDPTNEPTSSQPQREVIQTSTQPQTPVKPSPTEDATVAVSDFKRSSWYLPTWSGKSTPVTQVAREGVTVAKNVATQAATIVKDKAVDRPRTASSPALAMTLGKSKSNSNRALPADATLTKVFATSGTASPAKRPSEASDTASKEMNNTIENGKSKEKTMKSPPSDKNARVDERPVLQRSSTDAQKSEQEVTASTTEDSSLSNAGWFGWWSKPDIPTTQTQAQSAEAEPHTSVSEADKALANKLNTVEPLQKPEVTNSSETLTNSNKRTWLQMWSAEPPVLPRGAPASPASAPTNTQSESVTDNNIHAVAPTQDKTGPKDVLIPSPPPVPPEDGSKSSGWAFWSRYPKDTEAKSMEEEHVGELAISHTSSQDKPEGASISIPNEKTKTGPKLEADQDKAKDKVQEQPLEKKDTILNRPSTPVTDPKNPKPVQVKQEASTIKAESSKAKAIAKEPEEVKTPRQASPAPPAKAAANLLLPAFDDTLKPVEEASMLQQLARLLYHTKQTDLNHLHVVKDPPRVKNALAIGVHGYFPAPLIRSVLGQPTGTSIKFADMAAKAIKRYVNKHGYDCNVKSAALEGEGKISERVDLLWKLLLNWIDEIRNSDFVLIACHSQGVPVAIMLVAKLISFGCINSARVAICAMAGVNMGPFPEFKSRWIGGSAAELFEFSIPSSKVSTDYLAALEEVLKFGVRLSFIGSIDDQLVSLESAVFAPVTHPHIYRAVQIDSRIHAPSFLSHLVGFALKLRNLGVKDHGLIRELSSPLAGSLYTGEGHSRIYEDDAVYDLAITFGIETSSMTEAPLTQRVSPPTVSNPYILPFAMRGVLEEEYVKNELQNEASQLLKEFDEWKPTSKVLKDVKFRLEGIRSRL